MSTIGWSGSGRLAERMSWWLMALLVGSGENAGGNLDTTRYFARSGRRLPCAPCAAPATPHLDSLPRQPAQALHAAAAPNPTDRGEHASDTGVIAPTRRRT